MPKERILVVEDEQIVAKDIQSRLQRMQYAVPATAANGREAIAAADRTDPDVVLMDIRLNSEPDGIETARRIRARKDVPVIYVTAYGDEQTLQQAKQAEPSGYVLKPFDDQDLRIAIETSLYRHRARARRLAEQQRRCEQDRLRAIGQLAGGFANYHNDLLTVMLGNAELARRTLGALTDMTGSARDILRAVERLARLATSMPESDTHARPLRTLVTVLQGNADLLKRDLFAWTELPEMLAGIVQAGRQAQRLTADLMTFAGQTDRRDVPVDLHALIREVADDLRAGVGEEGCRVHEDLRAPSATVTGDPALLHAALMNLSINAREALTGDGQITFATDVVDFRPADADDGAEAAAFLRIRLTDSGVGMDDETRRQAFDPFFTTKTQARCAGLGLSAAHGIVHSHGGAIEIESQPLQGTTVTLLLPLAAV